MVFYTEKLHQDIKGENSMCVYASVQSHSSWVCLEGQLSPQERWEVKLWTEVVAGREELGCPATAWGSCG